MQILSAEPFFLSASPGKRFCLYHPPAGHSLQQAFIYLHPFAEEMNKARRMAALQAKALAAAGIGVLQIDLYGCGDSEGDFGDATWGIWKEDVTCARQWLLQKGFASVHFWGLRLGALLALDFVRDRKHENAPVKLILWQPVTNGKSFISRFLRLKLMSHLMSDEANEGGSVQSLRKQLESGESLEVAGYMLSPALVSAIDTLKLSDMVVNNSEIAWFEVSSEIERGLSSAGAAVVENWQRSGVEPKIVPVSCLPFWATQEISECTELIAATVEALQSMGMEPSHHVL